MKAVLTLQGVDVRLASTLALSGVNLQIGRGERVAFIGANGSGKSTLLRVLHGLQRPTQGAVQSDPASSQAMVFQRPYMLRTTARSGLVGLGRHRGVPMQIQTRSWGIGHVQKSVKC